MKTIRFQRELTLDVPDDWEIDDTFTQINLPDGRWLKPWIVLELNDECDLKPDEVEALGAENYDPGEGSVEEEV